MSEPSAAPAPQPTEQAGLIEDFVDIFFSPAKVFARRAAASPAMPFVIIVALIIAMYYVNRNVMSGIMESEMTTQMEKSMKSNPAVTAEQMERMKAVGSKFAQFGVLVGIPVALVVLGLVTWLVGKVLGGTLSYGTGLLIASFAWVPRVVESVLASVQGLLLDTSRMTSHFQLQLGPARFLDPATAPAWQTALLGRLDLITLWVTLLLAIGLVDAGKVPRTKLVVAGVVVWIVGSVPALLTALRG